MIAYLHLPPQSIEQIVAQILSTRCISRTVQRQLMQMALTQDELSPNEWAQVDRIEALRQRFIKVVD